MIVWFTALTQKVSDLQRGYNRYYYYSLVYKITGWWEEPEAHSRQWQDHNSGNQGGFNTKGQWSAAWVQLIMQLPLCKVLAADWYVKRVIALIPKVSDL